MDKQELKNLIAETVQEVAMEEGWGSDLWQGVKKQFAGGKTTGPDSGGSHYDRFSKMHDKRADIKNSPAPTQAAAKQSAEQIVQDLKEKLEVGLKKLLRAAYIEAEAAELGDKIAAIKAKKSAAPAEPDAKPAAAPTAPTAPAKKPAKKAAPAPAASSPAPSLNKSKGKVNRDPLARHLAPELEEADKVPAPNNSRKYVNKIFTGVVKNVFAKSAMLEVEDEMDAK